MSAGSRLADGWFTAAKELGQDPFLLMERWTCQQLRTFLSWLDRRWAEPSLSDHYLMQVAFMLSGKDQDDLNNYRLRFERKQAKRALSAEEKAAAQKAEDARQAALWSGAIGAYAGAVPRRPSSDKEKGK